MRDIRSDLQERLIQVEKELPEAENKVKSLLSTRDTLRAMLAMETNKWADLASQKPLLFTNGHGTAHPTENVGTPLSTILRDELSDQKKRHLAELAQAAVKRGYPFGDKKPGRVVHFALVGMRQANLVDQIGEGYWRLHAS